MSTQHQRSTTTEPQLIISWNADGLITHDGKRVCTSKIREVALFVNVHAVDLLLIQETHMIPPDIPFVEAQLRDNGFHEYIFYWSTNCNKGWRSQKTCSGQRWHGTGVIVRKGCEPLSVEHYFDGGEMFRWSEKEPYQHPIRNPEKEGRTLILEYKSLYVINTYVPHNGYGSVLRGKCKNNRRKNNLRNRWDGRLRHGLAQLQMKKSIIWAGDLNVAHTDLDVSHPYFFDNVQELRGRGRGYILVTQPGFTQMERENFDYTLKELDLVDTFRHFNNHKRVCSWEASLHVGDWAKSPIWSDKGMRLDYFICSRSILDRVISSKITDQAFGSDHYAIALELKPSSGSGKAADGQRQRRLSNSTKKY